MALIIPYVTADNIEFGYLPQGRLTGSYFITSSWAVTASHALYTTHVAYDEITSASWASSSLSASYLIGGVPTASYAYTSSVALYAYGLSGSITSASFSTTASYARSSSYSPPQDHTTLSNLNTANWYHLTQTNHTSLTSGGDSTLHYHSADRDLTLHTGVLPVSRLTGSYNISSSYATNAGTANTSTTATTSSYALTSSFFDGRYVVDATGQVGRNLMPDYLWTSGSGTVDIFTRYGYDAANDRVYDVGPFGDRVLIWRAISVGSASAGGWQTEAFPVDPNKSYRYSVYVKKPTQTNTPIGSVYLGCYGSNTLNLDGTKNANPYFTVKTNANIPADKWYLMVGYLWSLNTTESVNSGLAGMYDVTTGQLLGTSYNTRADLKCSSSYVQTHRAIISGNTVTGSYYYFWGPRVEEINSNTLPPSQLMLIPASASMALVTKTVNLDASVPIIGQPVQNVSTPLSRNVYNLATIRSAAATQTGSICFIAPSTGNVMHLWHIVGSQYASAPMVDMVIQGYRSGTSNWTDTSLAKTNYGATELQVRLGVTVADNKNVIILGNTSSTWSYPNFSIPHALFSHTNVSDAYCTGWTASFVSDESVFQQITELTTRNNAITASWAANAVNVASVTSASYAATSSRADVASLFYTVAGNTDVDFMRVAYDNSTSASWGVTFRYSGSGLGNNNPFEILTDNRQAATQIKAVSILQDGQVTFGAGLTGSLYGTSSRAISSDTSTSASYALVANSVNNQLWLNTGSTYPITSSWASQAVSTSYAPYQVTSSYSLVAENVNNQLWLNTGSTYPITSSWTENVISSSYAPTATNVLVQGGNSFGAPVSIGSNDNNTVNIEFNNGAVLTVSSSNVGIGTTEPTAKFDIFGNNAATTDFNLTKYVSPSKLGFTVANIVFTCSNDGASNQYPKTGLKITDDYNYSNPTNKLNIGLHISHSSNAGTKYAALFEGGRVGIGTSAPSTDLEVVGNVKATTFTGTASQATSASYALVAENVNNQLWLNTGSSYPITSSWAEQSVSTSYAPTQVTTSYALVAENVNNQKWLATGSTYPITSSWSNTARTASYYNQLWLNTGSTYPITSSWASNAATAVSTPILNNVAGNTDIDFIRVTYQDFPSASYGFTFRYSGSGTGANNPLEILADNQQAATQIKAITIMQDGQVTFGAGLTGSLFGNATTATSATSATSASYALVANTVNNQLWLNTGSTYPITSSWASNATAATTAITAQSANTATTASYFNQLWLVTGSTYPITASWSNAARTASYYNQLWLNTGSIYPITSSWAVNARTASYAPDYEPTFAKGNLVQGDNVTLTGTLTGRLYGTGNITIAASTGSTFTLNTGSTYQITSSWSNNARTASFLPVGTYAITSSWASRAISSSHALNADNAANAVNATNAMNASTATNAGYATTAGDADTLDSQHGAYYLALTNSTGVLPKARLTGSYSISVDTASFYGGTVATAAFASNASTLNGSSSHHFSTSSHLHTGVYEASFSKGDLVAGTGVSFSGTATGRLYGTGNLTINASGGTTLGTGSTYPITASWAVNATNATTAAFASQAEAATYATGAGNSNQLDGQNSSYYRNATNLNAGTVNSARLSGTYAITASRAVSASWAPSSGGVDPDANLTCSNFLAQGTGESRFSGFLGINTAPTTHRLRVDGVSLFQLGTNGGTYIPYTDANIYLSSPDLIIRDNLNAEWFHFDNTNKRAYTIAGAIGVGTSTPDKPLTIASKAVRWEAPAADTYLTSALSIVFSKVMKVYSGSSHFYIPCYTDV